ncbi:hypothetical protein [Rothia sp. ZJ932]|uniref:hypothetical protein n=1 Tax=Rothia sp. ZJ932 TaxID=2810516 RepID=UPI001967BAEB|nr:hypothetical protein [Rothia sp. ZJ932]QRZ61298.1 hypothetical protein JR346_08650 [Rothia sp. ZJ932]
MLEAQYREFVGYQNENNLNFVADLQAVIDLHSLGFSTTAQKITENWKVRVNEPLSKKTGVLLAELNRNRQPRHLLKEVCSTPAELHGTPEQFQQFIANLNEFIWNAAALEGNTFTLPEVVTPA